MKTAISSSGKTLESQIDPRFGRCAYFIICNMEDMSFETYDNENIALGGGAGIQSAQFIASKGAEAMITGNCGPNAVQTLVAAGVKLYTGQSGTVREAIERIKSDKTDTTKEANVPSHFGTKNNTASESPDTNTGNRNINPGSGMGQGMGGGRGMGQGMGGGRGMGQGMGGGRGMGMGRSSSNRSAQGSARSAPQSKNDELMELREQSKELSRQMQDIQERINDFEKGK